MIHLLEAEELQKWILKNEVSIIDVREKSEYDEDSISGSILIPLATLTIEKVKEISKNGKKIIIHCRSGARSLRACQMLMDYDNEIDVYNLEGGIIAWNALCKSTKDANEKNVLSAKNTSSSLGGCNS